MVMTMIVESKGVRCGTERDELDDVANGRSKSKTCNEKSCIYVVDMIWVNSFTDTRAIIEPSQCCYRHSLSFDGAIVAASTFRQRFSHYNHPSQQCYKGY
jgi:hypothetical protein